MSCSKLSCDGSGDTGVLSVVIDCSRVLLRDAGEEVVEALQLECKAASRECDRGVVCGDTDRSESA